MCRGVRGSGALLGLAGSPDLAPPFHRLEFGGLGGCQKNGASVKDAPKMSIHYLYYGVTASILPNTPVVYPLGPPVKNN